MSQAQVPQRLNRDGDDLGIRLRGFETDQLTADLEQLPFSARMFLFIPKNIRAVAQPQRKRAITHQGRHHACNLGSDIGTQKKEPTASTVHDLVAFRDHFFIQAVRQDVEVFKDGRDDLLITPLRKNGEKLPFYAALLRSRNGAEGRYPSRKDGSCFAFEAAHEMASRSLKKSSCYVLGPAGILTYITRTLRFRRSLRPCIWSFLSNLHI